MSPVLITGSTGYIGQNIAKSLVNKGFNVHLIARLTSNVNCFDGFSKMHIHRYDDKYATLNNIIREVRPNTVFHLATASFYDHTDHVEELVEANIQFGLYLLEAMKKNSCYYLVNTGSYAQHYNTLDYNPQNLYAATKQAFEAVIDYYVHAHKFKVITLKLVDVYGPNDTRKKIFNLLINAAVNEERLNLSPGGQLLDLIYIDDVVEAYVTTHFLLHEQKMQTSFHKKYFVASGVFTSLKEIVKLYSTLLAKEVPVLFGGRSYREREIMIPQIGELLPRWKAKISLKDGLQRLISADKILIKEKMQ